MLFIFIDPGIQYLLLCLHMVLYLGQEVLKVIIDYVFVVDAIINVIFTLTVENSLQPALSLLSFCRKSLLTLELLLSNLLKPVRPLWLLLGFFILISLVFGLFLALILASLVSLWAFLVAFISILESFDYFTNCVPIFTQIIFSLLPLLILSILQLFPHCLSHLNRQAILS